MKFTIVCSVRIFLILLLSGRTFAQDRPTTTTTTTQTTKTIQNADGTYTVIQYPADKEVTVKLTPGKLIPGAKGIAKVIRRGDATNIKLDLSNITGDVNNYNVYAVDPSGKFTLLGPVTVTNGAATQIFTTPLDKFMLVLSPEGNLTTMAESMPILFRSGVPQGFAVIPMGSRGERDGAAVGERLSAGTTSGSTQAYTAPLLGIPHWRQGTDTQMMFNFAGEMTGSRVNVSIKPRKDGATTIRMRFHDLKEAPAGKHYVLWAVSADNKYHRLGQVVNTGLRNEAEIRTETELPDFGLFITTEDVNDAPPAGALVAMVVNSRGNEIGTVWASIIAVPETRKFSVKYCPWADCYKDGKYIDDSPLWVNTTTGSRVPLDQPQIYIFIYFDKNGKKQIMHVDCKQNCEARCIY